jgi:hypothetical protein
VTNWRKSSYTGSGNDEACVEVASLGEGIGLRDSKNRDKERLEVGRQAFACLVAQVKRGELGCTASPPTGLASARRGPIVSTSPARASPISAAAIGC